MVILEATPGSFTGINKSGKAGFSSKKIIISRDKEGM